MPHPTVTVVLVLVTTLLAASTSCDSGCPNGTLVKNDVCQLVQPAGTAGAQNTPDSGANSAGTNVRTDGPGAGHTSGAAGAGRAGDAAVASAGTKSDAPSSSAGSSGGGAAKSENPAGASGGMSAAGAASGTAGVAGGSLTASPMCGNRMVESGETCDGECPTEASCASTDPCSKATIMGDAASCTATCKMSPITMCKGSDACCPDGCNAVDDSDCSPSCGNKILEADETCDPPSSCPSCDDADPCTTDRTTGSTAQCNLKCSHSPVTAPRNGDGCCPGGANAVNDNDCKPMCGNGVVEAGEDCDGARCPRSCNDSNPCTLDSLMGSASTCNAKCLHSPVESDQPGDGCCRPGRIRSQDSDCERECNTAADCTRFNKSACTREDNTCDGTVSTGTCNNGKCVVTMESDMNACKRSIACGAAYARPMPCPLGCFCTNSLDCAAGYMCSGMECVRQSQ